jgi:hypothetical protein
MHRQSGAISAGQLGELGLGPNQIARLLRSGILRRRYQGVYVDALAPLTPRGELVAAWLTGGPDGFLSHRTALALHGLRPQTLSRIELTVVTGHTPSHRRGLTVHRTGVPPLPHELRTTDGLPVASAPLALLQVAAREPDAELDRLIAGMARRRLLDLERIDRAIDRRQGLRGIRRLRAALARYRPPTAEDVSGFERDFAAWLTTIPGIPPPQRNAHLGPWELDFYWPAQRLVVETDGDQYHLTPSERERDVVKDAWLQRREHRVLRVTGFRFAHDRPGIQADLIGLLLLHSGRS